MLAMRRDQQAIINQYTIIHKHYNIINIVIIRFTFHCNMSRYFASYIIYVIDSNSTMTLWSRLYLESCCKYIAPRYCNSVA